jgi:hypothetical protein
LKFQLLALVVCCAIAAQGASVVRVPRVYNILIKSDGALAASEAISAAEEGHSSEEGDENPLGDAASASAEDETDEESERRSAPKKAPRQQQLPILNAKDGAVQEGVNYTEVPLSRAYPLTR